MAFKNLSHLLSSRKGDVCGVILFFLFIVGSYHVCDLPKKREGEEMSFFLREGDIASHVDLPYGVVRGSFPGLRYLRLYSVSRVSFPPSIPFDNL